jgi:hypothetical protein
MAESDKPSKADDNIAALRIKYEALTGKCRSWAGLRKCSNPRSRR